MRLGQLTGLERQKLEDEMADLMAKIAEYNEILTNHSKVLEIIKGELAEVKDKYGDDRRTEIQNISGEVDIEDLIPEENCIFTLTTMGYIKRQPVDTYKLQRRGGKGVIGMTRREEDFAETMFSCSTHDYIMFYTTKGKAYRLKGYEIPEGSRTSKGMNIVNLLPLEADEKVSAMIRVPKDENEEELFLCMFTRKGIIKRSSLSEYKTIRKTGIIAINLDEDDELAWVKLTHGNDDILLATKKGMSIRFNENDARPIGRTARGVRAISLKEGDEVIGMDIITDDSIILTVSETGYGRRSMGSDYRVQTRGGLGLINYRTETYGEVAALRVVNDDEDIIIISSDGVIIRIPADSISIFARPSKGVRVMKVKEGERVVTLTNIEHSDEENEETESSETQAETTEENQD
jgi:DNA gyrase subunit A